ncbi:hypothetical protein N9530_04040 [Ascidiaceihabitans sp.]|nr:hypothetical protein [Ascidiaceihabitans sp.]
MNVIEDFLFIFSDNIFKSQEKILLIKLKSSFQHLFLFLPSCSENAVFSLKYSISSGLFLSKVKSTMAEYGRVYPGPIEPDVVGQKRVDAITEELEKLQLEMEDESLETDAYNALYDRVDALEDEARDLQEAYSAEDLALAGVIASWSNGQITLHVGLVRPADKPEATSQTTSAGGRPPRHCCPRNRRGGAWCD